jgi:uncharacterized protein YyaL (SSP411 family)
MITGLAHAAKACQRPDWLQAARAALEFLRRERWQDGPSGGRLLSLTGQDAFLDDHAFLLEALLALHDADPQDADLPWARAVAQALLALFEDPDEGGFFFTRHDAPALIHRPKNGVDAATPSGNGTAALALQALAQARRAATSRRRALRASLRQPCGAPVHPRACRRPLSA